VSQEKRKLLVVEDDPGLQSQLRWALSDSGEVHLADDRAAALVALRREAPAVVVLDLGLPPDTNGASEGLAALSEILALQPATKVIIASGNEDRENAVKAIGLGAYDFYPKPVDIDVLRLIIERAWRLHDLEEERRRLLKARETSPLAGVIAASTEMLKVCRAVERIAAADVSVLLTGESGTGKEVLAHALHGLGARADQPFVAINCAAIPETLLESELFGHEKGAFTGAIKQTVGKIEQANRGTLFLDEIGDMPLALQAKLLRFLQDRTIERIGGRKTIAVDLRIISATNQNLASQMAEGRFREDLFYRINEVGIEIPPLRARTGDAVLLANFYLRRFNKSFERVIKGFTGDALAAIAAHPWPGNVRELENRMKRAMVMADGKMISAVDLDLADDAAPDVFPTLKQLRERAEFDAVTQALALARDNVSQAAKLLGVSRPTLYDLMRQFRLKA
jgi:two-component system NtrC family response regulator